MIGHHSRYIQPLTYEHMQTLALEYRKSTINERGYYASTTFSRTLEVCSLGNKDGKNKYCITCIQADLRNVQQSDYLVRLKLFIMEVFDVLVLSTDQHGKIIRIHNFNYLKEQWNNMRPEILQDHDEEEHLQLVWNMDILMQHEHTVIAYLQLPSNYGLYFNGYKSIDINKKTHTNNTLFGEELSNKAINEILDCAVTSTNSQQLVEFSIGATNYEDILEYSGSCKYLDGVLDVCVKEIKTEFFTLNYSAKWAGLKKSFLQ